MAIWVLSPPSLWASGCQRLERWDAKLALLDGAEDQRIEFVARVHARPRRVTRLTARRLGEVAGEMDRRALESLSVHPDRRAQVLDLLQDELLRGALELIRHGHDL